MGAARKQVHERLAPYRKKRDFSHTAEPSGATSPRPGRSFVVQKHAASRLHYDFRLELDGVLLSWAVPKGPSLNSRDRRLAVRVEDHPLSYRDFEGVIPAGEYGGGTVIVWDRGNWQAEGDARAALEAGRLSFTLDGEKLRGRFHLIHTRGHEWLLFKSKDARASGDSIVDSRPESVLSGRSLEAVGAAPERVWHSNRAAELPRGLDAARARELTALAGRLSTSIKLTNLDKILYPEDGVTKAALVAHYATVRERILPLIAGRPLSLYRCPDGVGRSCFFQKHASAGVPAAIGQVPITEDDGTHATHLRVDDLDGLLGLVQLGVLEIHTWGCHADSLERPDLLVFDLDPDVALPWGEVVRGARDLRALLEHLGLEAFVKTTGGKGLHVVVPVERRVDWEDFKAFSRGIAELLARTAPDRFVAVAGRGRRGGKIFIDYLRNGRGATAVAPYSTRARPGATVATPVAWEELDSLDPRALTVLSLPAFLDAQQDDPWARLPSVRQRLTVAMRRKVGAS